MKALFPLDGSDATYGAVERGLHRLSKVKDARATFLVVLDRNLRAMPEHAVEYLKYDDDDEIFIRDDEAKAVLDRAGEIAKRVRFSTTEGRAVVGKVYDVIIEESKKHDVLVMHRKEDSAGSGILEKLERGAHCDVWLV